MTKKEEEPLIKDVSVLKLDGQAIIVFEQEFAAMAKNPRLPCPCLTCPLTRGFKYEPDPRYEERIKEFFKLYEITDTPEERERWAEAERKFHGIYFTQTEQDMAAEISKAIGKRTAKQKKEG